MLSASCHHVTALQVYNIEYSEGFYPYILIGRQHVPWYDERMRG